MRTAVARRPGVSLCELMLLGLLSEEDVLPGGKVDDEVRIRAEIQHAALMTGGTTTERSVDRANRNTATPRSVPQRPRSARTYVPRAYVPRPPQTTARDRLRVIHGDLL